MGLRRVRRKRFWGYIGRGRERLLLGPKPDRLQGSCVLNLGRSDEGNSI